MARDDIKANGTAMGGMHMGGMPMGKPNGGGNHHHGSPPMSENESEPEQHAFVMLGTDTFFLSHLTMFHMESHRYQLILEVRLSGRDRDRFLAERARASDETYFMGNTTTDLMTIPEIQVGSRRSMLADIYRGIPDKPAFTDWPWKGVGPVMKNVQVVISRVVYCRHFD